MSEHPYSDKVMDHFMNPRNVGEIPDASGVGTVGNVICGDVMKMYLKIENDVIIDAKFKTFGCLPADEKIVLSEGGWIKVSDIVRGMSVINSQGCKAQAAETYQRAYSAALLKIMPFVSPFNSFRVTPEHPIFCVRRAWVEGARRQSSQKCDWLRLREEKLFSTKPDFIRAGDLSKGDYLIFNVNRDIKDNALFTKEIMRLMGYYLSEGYITAQGSVVAFAFNKKEQMYVNEVAALLKKTIGKEPKSRTRGNVIEVYVCSRKLARFLITHCNKMARNKSLSEAVLLLPFSKQRELIETYLRGDGNNYRRRLNNSKTYRIITTSESLAIQTQEILARGGIFASIRQIHKTNCYIGNRKLKDSVQYQISFMLVRDKKFVHSNNQYFFVPIKQIDTVNFTGPVYNFQVSNEPNSYLVRGFAVHNCGAAIATSSMVTEMVKGKSIQEALKISNQTVAEALGGLPPIKMHCSVLAEEALRSALKDYYQKQGRPAPFADKPAGHGHGR